MTEIIQLTPDELNECIRFSKESAKTQQKIEFGQHDTLPRSESATARDNLIGKMAEAAVKRFLQDSYGIDTSIDFNVYGRGVWDDHDLAVNGWNIDIKSTRCGHWFLIEWNKLSFRRRQGKLPDAFFACKTPWNRNNDTPKGTVELCGAVSLSRLCRNDPEIQIFRKGDILPGTQNPFPLQADNYAVEFRHLCTDWDSIINYMINNRPADPGSFVNFPFD